MTGPLDVAITGLGKVELPVGRKYCATDKRVNFDTSDTFLLNGDAPMALN
jgi:hypothetical protein